MIRTAKVIKATATDHSPCKDCFSSDENSRTVVSNRFTVQESLNHFYAKCSPRTCCTLETIFLVTFSSPRRNKDGGNESTNLLDTSFDENLKTSACCRKS